MDIPLRMIDDTREENILRLVEHAIHWQMKCSRSDQHEVTPLALAIAGFHGPYLHLYHHQTTAPLIVRERAQYSAIVLTLEGCSPSGDHEELH